MVAKYNNEGFWENFATFNLEIEEDNDKVKKEKYEKMKKKLELFQNDGYWFQPTSPKQNLVKRVKAIKYISTTHVGEKMNKIAEL